MNAVEPEVSIGASDSLIITISITGFAILATTFYFVLLRPTNGASNTNDGNDPTNPGAPSYDQLKRTKVSELNRAQRRARARTIAKEETKSLGTKEERQRKLRDIELRERRAEQSEIDRLQEQQLQQAAMEKARRNAEKAAELNHKKEQMLVQWETFVEGNGRILSVAELDQMLKKKRTLNIDHVSEDYGIPEETVSSRLLELVHDGRIAGVFSNSKQFVYFSDEELRAIIDELKERHKMSYSELADFCQQRISGGTSWNAS